MHTEARIEQARDLELRVESMIDLASVFANAHDLNTFPEVLEDFMVDNFGVKNMDPEVAALVKALHPSGDDDDPDFEPELEALLALDVATAGQLLVQFGTPMRAYSSDTSWRSNWGCYYTHWIAAPSFDEAWAKGVAWAESRHEHDRAKPG